MQVHEQSIKVDSVGLETLSQFCAFLWIFFSRNSSNMAEQIGTFSVCQNRHMHPKLTGVLRRDGCGKVA